MWLCGIPHRVALRHTTPCGSVAFHTVWLCGISHSVALWHHTPCGSVASHTVWLCGISHHVALRGRVAYHIVWLCMQEEYVLSMPPLYALLDRIAVQHGLQGVDPGCSVLLALAVEAHLTRLLMATAKVAGQRADPARCASRACLLLPGLCAYPWQWQRWPASAHILQGH